MLSTLLRSVRFAYLIPPSLSLTFDKIARFRPQF